MKFSIEVLHIMHPGKRKDQTGNSHQEDSIYPAPQQLGSTDRLFVLCDGMGGHDAGEVASDTVCRAIGDYITGECDRQGAFTPEILNKSLDAAFDALDAADTGAARKMGTTMAMLKLYDKGAIVAHIGDSRIYHIRPGADGHATEVLHRTFDHSLVFDMIKAGVISEKDARKSPHKNVITKALQPDLENRPYPDITKITDIRPGDYFYICSDGMTENMDTKELREIFSSEGGDMENIRQTLTDLTEDNYDNHTAIIVHITSVTASEDDGDTADGFDAISAPPMPVDPSEDVDLTGGGDTADDDTDTGRHSSLRPLLIIGIIAAIAAVLAYVMIP